MAKPRRKAPTRARPARPSGPTKAGDRRLLMGFAMVAALALGLAAFNLSRHRGSSPAKRSPTSLTAAQRKAQTAAQAWRPQVTAAFKAVSDDLPDFVSDTQHWSTGALDDAQFRINAQSYVRSFVEGRDAVTHLSTFSVDRRANDLYLRSAQLYEQSARIEVIAVDTPNGPVRVQLRLMGQRVRELADRVFDRGGAIVTGALRLKNDPNFVVNLPEEVPIWAAEGLAAGPPLDVEPTGPVGLPPQHQATRPQEPRRAWRAAVTRLAVPSAPSIAALIATGAADQLGAAARSLAAAEQSLRVGPDPSGDREGATIVRLGLLVDAEAARAAQVSRVVAPGPDVDQLTLIAERLALVSDHLWAPDLPPRHSPFASDLLRAGV